MHYFVQTHPRISTHTPLLLLYIYIGHTQTIAHEVRYSYVLQIETFYILIFYVKFTDNIAWTSVYICDRPREKVV